MRFLKLLGKYVPPYTGNLLLYVLFTVLTAVFSVFSFSAVIPLLKILFGLSDSALVHETVEHGSSWSDAMEVLENNILYAIQGQMSLHGGAWALFLIGIFVVVTALLANASSFMADYCRVPIRTGILRDVRKEMYDRILYVSNGFLSTDNRGDAMSRMTSDALEFEWCIADALNMLVKDPVKIVVYLVTLFVISWRLAMVSLALLVIFGIVTYVIGTPVKDIAHRGQAERGEILSAFDETFGSISAIKSYNSENHFAEEFGSLNERNRRTFTTLNRVIALVTSTTDWLVMVVLAALLWIGGGQVLAHISSIGAAQFIYFLIVFYSVTKPTRDLASNSYGIRKCMASVERVDKILNLKVDLMAPGEPVEPDLDSVPAGAPLIEFRDVSFAYEGGTELFRGMDLTIMKGEKVAIVGRVGAGKSSVASLVLRFFDVDGGSVSLAGTDVRMMDAHRLRSHIAYVSQDTVLFNCSVYENILLGNRQATSEQVQLAARKAGIHDFIISLPEGYDTVVGDRGCSLSGGQRQAISIARAILKDAPVLILDEATSALDSSSERDVMESLRLLMEGRTVITITHHLPSESGVDKIIEISEGKALVKQTDWA